MDAARVEGRVEEELGVGGPEGQCEQEGQLDHGYNCDLIVRAVAATGQLKRGQRSRCTRKLPAAGALEVGGCERGGGGRCSSGARPARGPAPERSSSAASTPLPTGRRVRGRVFLPAVPGLALGRGAGAGLPVTARTCGGRSAAPELSAAPCISRASRLPSPWCSVAGGGGRRATRSARRARHGPHPHGSRNTRALARRPGSGSAMVSDENSFLAGFTASAGSEPHE